MDIQAIENYIKQYDTIDMPSVQERFELTYSDVVKAFDELEKKGVVKYCDGFKYTLTSKATQATYKEYTPTDSQEAAFIKALWQCIKENSVSVSFLQRKCTMGYFLAAKAVNWMEKNGYISSENGLHPRNVLMTREQYIEKFGKPYDDVIEESDDDDSFTNKRREILKKLMLFDDEEDKDDDEDYDIDDDDDMAMDSQEDADITKQELSDDLQRSEEDTELKLDELRERVEAEILKGCDKMPEYNAEDGTFTTKMNVVYPDGSPFRIKLFKKDANWYLSDCGKTIDYLSAFNNRQALTDYLQKNFTSANACVLDYAVCTTVDDLDDLQDESAFLFNMVDSLVTQQYFDAFYLGEELVSLAHEFLEKENPEMLLNALLAIGDTPIRIPNLRDVLKIDFVQTVHIIGTLSDFGLVERTGATVAMTEKCSNDFIEYLKRMLDKKTDE